MEGFMKKIKNFSQQKPILAILAVYVITFLFQRFSWLLFSVFPDNMLRAYVRELYDMLWPVALSLLFGFRFIYHRKGFGATLITAMPLLIWSIFVLFLSWFITFFEGAQWQTTPAILLGILHMIGIGVREEVIYRGIIGNALALKYATDKKGLWFAVIVSALIFGSVHITNIFYGVKLMGLMAQIVAAFAIGLSFAAIYLRGGNIWVLVLIHAIIDTGAFFNSSFTVTAETKVDMVSNQNPWGAVMYVCLYTCVALFLLRKSKQPAVSARLEQLRNQSGWSEVSNAE
jgi:membrane protease YdiL (CAAX protease family)